VGRRVSAVAKARFVGTPLRLRVGGRRLSAGTDESDLKDCERLGHLVKLREGGRMSQSRARNDVVVPEGSLESICGGSVERSAMNGPCLLPGRTDAACLLITDNADNAADGVQVGPEPEVFRRQTLDLTLVSIDLLESIQSRGGCIFLQLSS
jgi:hypothetical protein